MNVVLIAFSTLPERILKLHSPEKREWMSLLVAPDDWALELADSVYSIPGIIGDQAVWELPAVLDIELLHKKDCVIASGAVVHRVIFTDHRVSTERDDSMPSGETEDGRTWFYADITITVNMASKIYIMQDVEIAPSFLIELDGDMDTLKRRTNLIALGFREL
ncbi:MAG: hypothetical protein UZ21_OP11001001019 [Microgenomates bacterium OLB22]|nr:MAG: hypothetical protein UZ21_OP11001001019 [Microgenomates bacterium OLB22]